MFCSNCGGKVDDGDKYCAKCGKELSIDILDFDIGKIQNGERCPSDQDFLEDEGGAKDRQFAEETAGTDEGEEFADTVASNKDTPLDDVISLSEEQSINDAVPSDGERYFTNPDGSDNKQKSKKEKSNVIPAICGLFIVGLLFAAVFLPVFRNNYKSIALGGIGWGFVVLPLLFLIVIAVCCILRKYGILLILLLMYAEFYAWTMYEEYEFLTGIYNTNYHGAVGLYLSIICGIALLGIAVWGIAVKYMNRKRRCGERKKQHFAKSMVAYALLLLLMTGETVLLLYLDNIQEVASDGRTNGDLNREYKEAVQYIKAEEYEKAIQVLDELPDNFRKYDKALEQREIAVEGLENDIIKQADAACEEGDYVEALAVIEEGIAKLNASDRLDNKYGETLERCKDNYFLKAQNFADKKDYAAAISTIEEMADFLGYDLEMSQEIYRYQKEQIIDRAWEYADAGNYSAAISYLEQQIPWMENDAEMLAELDKIWELYKNACIESADAYVENGDYDNAITLLTNLKASVGEDADIGAKLLEYGRARISADLERFDEEKAYRTAILYLEEQMAVPEFGLQEDVILNTRLEEYKKLYAETLLAKAEKSAKKEEYAAAVSALREGSSLVEGSNSYSALSDAMQEYRKQQAITDLAVFKKAKDYKGAVSYFNNLFAGEFSGLKTDAELLKKQLWYVEKYKTELFEKAEKSYQSVSYNAALKVLEEAKTVIPDDSELLAKIRYYEEKRPVRLSSLKIYDGSIGYHASSIVDVNGTVYDEYFCNYEFGISYDQVNKVVYFLDKKYALFQCKLVLIDASGSYDRELIIKNDDTNEVLFSKRLGKKDTDGITVNIDVSDVKFLRIEMTECLNNRVAMVEAQLVK